MSQVGLVSGITIGVSTAIGALTSLFPWVAVSVSTGSLAWLGGLGTGCGILVGYIVSETLSCCGLNQELAHVIGIVVAVATHVILTGGILIGSGIAAAAAFTISVSTLIIPTAILVAIIIGYIAFDTIF